jgi:hypothetical protein
MEFKKISNLQKWFLKYTDRPKYVQYKAMLQDLVYHDKTKLQQNEVLDHPYKSITSFCHSGNCGDIIYSLPTVFELSKNGKANLYLKIDQPGKYDNYHPLGNVMLNKKMVDMFIPLMKYQPQINECAVYNAEVVDYDLDVFRNYSFLQDRGNIARWYFYVYAISPSLHKPWLIAPLQTSYNEYIVIARSHRYRSPLIDYSFLQKFKKIIFLGVEEEFVDMKQMIPNIEFKKVKDFLEMATIINSCKLFIGNQSFPFSIAEALKVKRILEVYYRAPNVIVEGKGAHDFIYQPQFEKLVSDLLK